MITFFAYEDRKQITKAIVATYERLIAAATIITKSDVKVTKL